MAVKESGTHLQDEIVGIMKKYNCPSGLNQCVIFEGAFNAIAKEIVELTNKRRAEWFAKGQNSIQRKNKSGCCCKFSADDTEIISLCGEHENYYEERLKRENKDGE